MDNSGEFIAAHEFVNGTTGSFYRPTVTYLANDNVVMAWDDGASTYKSVYNGSSWSVPEVYCNAVSPQVMTHGTDGLLSSTKLVATTPGGPPYQLHFPSGPCSPQVAEDEGVDVIASEADQPAGDAQPGDSTSFFSVRLSSGKLKLTNGSVVPLNFVPSPDTLRLHEGNAWQRLTTLPITLPSGIDSILLDGAVALRSRGRFLGIERGLRLSFDLIDAQTGQTIRRVGTERGFGRDTTHVLQIRDRLNSLAGRRIIIRPNINWAGRGTQRTKYTLVHVHTLYVDSAATSLSSLAKVSSNLQNQLPTVFALHPNYPNPFNPTTQINFDLPENASVSLVVYDVLGKQVAELARGHREAGYHNATWNALSQASGVYFARLVATDMNGKVKYSRINKLLLMK